jgi:signal transduction histidine kinase
MNMRKMKWISALFTTIFIGVFEFVRHHFLDFISMSWGNLLVAVVSGLLFYIYFHGVFSLLENLYKKLQKEQEERVVLQERDRIARELHDSVSQALFFMNVKVLEIEAALKKEQCEPLAAVKELQEAIKFTDRDIRQHIFALQKITHENINLVVVFQKYIADYEAQNNIKMGLKIDGDINSELTNAVRPQLLRIFQELLFNIRKHAEAKQVDISLIKDGKQFSMVVRDNGKGFHLENLKTNNMSFGFKMLEADVDAIGGRLNVQSFPGKGTTVTIDVELK